jgi:hypothetical protein
MLARVCSAFVRFPFGKCSALVRAMRVWIMDDNFQEILDSLPEKRPRSRLEPYGRLIDELLRRRWTYRGIARILAEKCQLKVSSSTIHDFVRRRSRSKRNLPKRREPAPAETMRVSPAAQPKGKTRAGVEERELPPVDEVHQRIAALKQRPVPAQTSPKQFHYDPSEPLRLRPKGGKQI